MEPLTSPGLLQAVFHRLPSLGTSTFLSFFGRLPGLRLEFCPTVSMGDPHQEHGTPVLKNPESVHVFISMNRTSQCCICTVYIFCYFQTAAITIGATLPEAKVNQVTHVALLELNVVYLFVKAPE